MKNIMKEAWRIAKEAAAKFGGRAIQYIAEALRMAWAAVKAPKAVIDRIEELEEMGFRRWQKNGMDRLYINATALGLNYSRYKTGNVSSAWFDGTMISNCECRRMLDAKTYIDVKTQMVYSTNEILGKAAAKLAGVEFAR